MDEDIKNLPDIKELGDVIGDGFLWGSEAVSYRSFPARTSQINQLRSEAADKLSANFKLKFGDQKVYANIKQSLDNKLNFQPKLPTLNTKNYQASLALANKLNLNSVLINVDWAKIEPERGQYSNSALKLYARIFHQALGLNLIPVISLWDASHPQWFEDAGAFSKRKNVDLFLKFVHRVVQILPPASTIITFVDPTSQFGIKLNVEGKKLTAPKLNRTTRNITLAHRQAIKMVKKANPLNKAGMALGGNLLRLSPSSTYGIQGKMIEKILLKESKISSDFVAAAIDLSKNPFLLKLNNKKQVKNLTSTSDKQVVHGDLDEGLSENQIVYTINHLDKKLEMPILLINRGVSDLEQKYYAKELEFTINAIFKTGLQGASIIGLIYSSLLNSHNLEDGILTSKSLASVNRQTNKVKVYPRARALQKLIAKLNKARKPNYQPVVGAIIESMNQYKKSKKNKAVRAVRESFKKITIKVGDSKYKRLYSAETKLKLLNKPKAAVLKLDPGGEGINPFSQIQKASGKRTAKLKSSAKSANVKLKSGVKSGTKAMGDFIKKPSLKLNKTSKTTTKSGKLKPKTNSKIDGKKKKRRVV